MTINKYTLIFIFSILIFSSCENKRDDNEEFGGMWQLVKWQDSQSKILADENSRIFYCVRLNLMKFYIPSEENYYLSKFKRTSDSIYIYQVVSYINDSIVNLTELAKYGVPEDGGFKIEHLSSDKMILSSYNNRLLFRKY